MAVALLAPVLVAVLALALASGLWVGFALIVVGLVAMGLSAGAPPGPVFATEVWQATSTWHLTSLPMFVWMGKILFRSRLAEDLFAGLEVLAQRLPGGLLHVNVFGCALFGAVSGSSAVTTARAARETVEELDARGYAAPVALGSLAASGTLGFLIPPSIVLIVYGAATQQSIARLFLAGLVPGLMVAAMISGSIALWALIQRGRMPPAAPARPPGARLRAVGLLVPTLGLIAAVLGAIYLGIASATEAAVVGVAGALALAARDGGLDRGLIAGTLAETTKTTCLVAFILIGAAFLTAAMRYTGIPGALAVWIGAVGVPAPVLLAGLTAIFILLGLFLDAVSLVALAVALVRPTIEAVGIDPLWFGVFLAVLGQLSQLTPPVGFNLFVLHGLTGRPIAALARFAAPFAALLLLALVVLTLVPGLALWLPAAMAHP